MSTPGFEFVNPRLPARLERVVVILLSTPDAPGLAALGLPPALTKAEGDLVPVSDSG